MHRLAPPLVGHADDRRLANGRVPRDDALDFGGVDILAAADDHVLDPVADEEIALGVEIAGVARQEEAIRGEHLRAFFGALPIAGHRRAAPDPDFADAAGRSEEHTSELQSLMRTSYAVFC